MATKVVSVLTGGTNSHETTSEEINAQYTDLMSDGIVGAITNTSGVAPATGNLAVNAQGTPDMTVAVSQGVAYVTGTPTGGNSQRFRVSMWASENVTIAANSTGGTRYDHIYIKLDPDTLANPNTAGDDVATLVASRSTSASTDNGTPPTYGYKIAVVTVANGASSIVNANITDSRVRTGVSSIKGDLQLTQSAAASDAKINALGADTNIHMALTPKGNGLVKTAVLRQDDTTNTYQKGNTVMLTGWGVITATATYFFTETASFGVTFAQAPIVIATFGGDHASSSTYGSGGATVKIAMAQAHTITTSGFSVTITSRDGTNWAAGNKLFYQWIAIGELA
jgi:hypothetical protein